MVGNGKHLIAINDDNEILLDSIRGQGDNFYSV